MPPSSNKELHVSTVVWHFLVNMFKTERQIIQISLNKSYSHH